MFTIILLLVLCVNFLFPEQQQMFCGHFYVSAQWNPKFEENLWTELEATIQKRSWFVANWLRRVPLVLAIILRETPSQNNYANAS